MFARDQPSRLAGRQRECVMSLPFERRSARRSASYPKRDRAGHNILCPCRFLPGFSALIRVHLVSR